MIVGRAGRADRLILTLYRVRSSEESVAAAKVMDIEILTHSREVQLSLHVDDRTRDREAFSIRLLL